MKCTPYNVKLLLEKWSLKDQLILFNDDYNQKIVNAINQIGDDKRYKLSFLLNAFVKMTEAMDADYKDFEPDYDSISQSVAEDSYWEEGYKEMFDHETFWRELSNAVETEEISDFIIENSDTNDFITNTFNYGKDDGEVKQFVTKQELIDAISSFENIPELTRDLDEAKKTVNLEYYFQNRFLSEFLKRDDVDYRQATFNEEESELILKGIYKNLAEIYSENLSDIEGNSRSKLQDILKDQFEDTVFDYWFNQNRQEFQRSEEESVSENASYEFARANRTIGKNYLGDEEQDPDARHRFEKGFTDRIKQHEWVAWNNDHTQIIVQDNPISKLGIDQWNAIADELKQASDENQVANTSDYITAIEEYVDVVKFTIETDPGLKLVFSEETLFYKIEDSNIEKQTSIIAKVIDDMSPSEGAKFKEFISLDNQRAQLIESAQERKKQEEELEKIREQKEEEEKRRRDEIYKIVQEEKERHTEESLTKNFDEEEIAKAKELGISKNPFAHKLTMKLDVVSRFSGQRQYPESTGNHLSNFHLFVQPKISSNDPIGMSDVFDKNKGLNYHGGLLGDAPASSEHYNYIGWIRGVIDFHEKIAYVEEMQSDIMQNTTSMKDIEKSIATLSSDKKNIQGEIDALSKQTLIDSSTVYDNRIQKLREQLKNIKNTKMIPGIELAISTLEKEKQLGKDPLSRNNEKLFKLNERLKQVEKEIDDVKRYESDKSNINKRRPNLYEFRSRVERKYSDWIELFFNSIFKYCNSIGIKKLYIVSAAETKKAWIDYVSEGTMSLYEKVYDEQTKKHNMKKIQYKGGSWWVLDLLENKPKFASSWYGKLKFAQSRSVDISDLIIKFENKEIDKTTLEEKIKERYTMAHSENMDARVFQQMATNHFSNFFKAREDDFGTSESPTEWERIEKIQEAIAGFMTTTGKAYMEEGGELKEPYNTILSRLLIQKYQYDMDLKELTD